MDELDQEVVVLIELEAAVVVMVLIVIAISVRYTSRTKLVSPDAFVAIVEACRVQTVVIERRGLMLNRVSVIKDGWKISAVIAKNRRLPAFCDVIG